MDGEEGGDFSNKRREARLQRDVKAAAAAAARQAADAKRAEGRRLNHEQKVADARAARIKAGDLDARFTHGDHMLDTVPLPSDMENASRDALAALHLNQSCTGLGENDALFELRYCDLTPDQRDEMIIAAKYQGGVESGGQGDKGCAAWHPRCLPQGHECRTHHLRVRLLWPAQL